MKESHVASSRRIVRAGYYCVALAFFAAAHPEKAHEDPAQERRATGTGTLR